MLAYAHKHGSITHLEIQQLLQVSQTTANWPPRRMLAQRSLRQAGRGAKNTLSSHALTSRIQKGNAAPFPRGTSCIAFFLTGKSP